MLRWATVYPEGSLFIDIFTQSVDSFSEFFNDIIGDILGT